MKNGFHIDEDGSECWYLNDKRHREDGPAVIYADGSRCWYLDGKLHREEGPAVVDAIHNTEAWCLHNRYLGCGAEGFWTQWTLLTSDQRNNLNLHIWLAKYT